MNILKTSRELTKIEIYKMTKDASIISLKNLEEGSVITPAAWIEYEDTNSRGETGTILSILDTTGAVIAFQSETARRSFKEIAELFEGEEFSVCKMSGKTKAGRDYCNISLAM